MKDNGPKKRRVFPGRIPSLDIPLRIPELEWTSFPEPKRYFTFFYSKKYIILVLLLTLATYLLTQGQSEPIRRVAAIFVLVAGCWLFEIFPIYITGLMVPVLLTFAGIFKPAEAFEPFAHPVIFLLIGGLTLGQAVVKHGIDRRIAFSILRYSMGKLEGVVMVSMLTTAFISMWISNTVAIAILLPVVLTILASVPDDMLPFKRRVLFGMAVSATLGGMAMLTGSTPNMIVAALLESRTPFGFLQWAYYGIPVVVLSLVSSYFILKRLFRTPDAKLDLGRVMDQNRSEGPMGFSQKMVIAIFGFTILLWFFGSQAEIFLGLPSSISSAAIVSILSVLVMFGSGLLDMKDLKSIHWEIMFLVGGGILLGEAMVESGLAGEIGGAVASTSSFLPVVMMILLFTLLTIALTNFISNSATAAILGPIAIAASDSMGMNPIPFVMGIGLGASVAFITPVGTPSTAMVYSTGLIPKGMLIKYGLMIGIIVALVISIITFIFPIP